VEAALAALQAVPAGDPAQRLQAAAEVYAALGWPRPSLSPDPDDDLKTQSNALSQPAEDAWRVYHNLASAVERVIVEALAAGARVPGVAASVDFGPDGLDALLGRPDPFVFLPGVKGHASGVSGSGVEEPVYLRGRVSALQPDHPLRQALRPDELLQDPAAGGLVVLGWGSLVYEPGKPPYARPRPFYFVDDVVALTRTASAQQRRERQDKEARERWEQAQRKGSAELRKTPEQQRQEADLAETRRQLQEQRAALEQSQLQLRELLRRQAEAVDCCGGEAAC